MPFNYLRKLTGHERTQNGGAGISSRRLSIYGLPGDSSTCFGKGASIGRFQRYQTSIGLHPFDTV